jgi:hypothetical protein
MRSLPLALALAVASPAAAGPSITLNGANVDGVTGQRFENCTVVIDERGDVHIEAKGYAVRAAGAARAAPAGQAEARAGGSERLSRRYFLATEVAPPGSPYDLAVFINAQWIREVKASEPAVVLEITRYLRPGENKIVLAPTRRSADRGGRDGTLKVVVGEGDVGGDHVMIDAPLVEMTRAATEPADRSEEYVIQAR